jgi:hypothetical protein
MANTDLLSYTVSGSAGDPKPIPVYFPTGMSLANIQAGSNALVALINSCIDGKVLRAQVTMQLTLPGGLNGSAAGDTRVGALLGFDCTGTPYRHSIFFPTWKTAGFSASTVASGSPNDDLIAAIEAGFGTGGSEVHPSDKYANDIVSFLEGLKKVRK